MPVLRANPLGGHDRRSRAPRDAAAPPQAKRLEAEGQRGIWRHVSASMETKRVVTEREICSHRMKPFTGEQLSRLRAWAGWPRERCMLRLLQVACCKCLMTRAEIRAMEG